MATELEFVKYKDFVESIPEATEFASGDKSIVSNSVDGPRCVAKPKEAKINNDNALEFIDANRFYQLNCINSSDSNYEESHMIAYNTGISYSSADYDVTGFIPVSPGDVLNAVHNYRNCCIYDYKKTWIAGYNDITNQVTIPANGAFVRFSLYRSTIATQMISQYLPSKHTAFDGKWYIKPDSSNLFPNAVKDANIESFVCLNMLNLLDANFAQGYYWNDSAHKLSANASLDTTGFIPVVPEQVIVSNKSLKYAVCFDSNFKEVAGSYSSTFTNNSYTVPSGSVYLRFTISHADAADCMVTEQGFMPASYYPYDGKKYVPYKKIILKESVDVDDLYNTCLENMLNLSDADFEAGKYISSSAGALAGNSALDTSGFMRVRPGQVIKSNRQLRFVLCYDSKYTAISASYGSFVEELTIPEGAAYLRVTFRDEYISDIMITPYAMMPAFYKAYDGKKYIDPAILPNNSEFYHFAHDGSVASGSSMESTDAYVVNNMLLTFVIDGEIEDVSCGFGYGEGVGEWIQITPTNIVAKYGNPATTIGTYAHGLTLGNNTTLTIDKDSKSETAKVRLYNDKGQMFEQEVTWKSFISSVFVRNDSSASINAKIRYMPRDLNKAIWMFGDSYFGLYNYQRWMYYIIQTYGFDKFLLNARPGVGSTASVTCLKNLLSISKAPKYVVWCLGMNNASDTDVPNATWKADTDEVLRICRLKNITPVFATIPSVPTLDHSKKNAYLKSLGVRIIDIADAVEEEGETTWKWYGTATAFLSNDNIHPSEFGAKAIAERVLVDFPEIAVED